MQSSTYYGTKDVEGLGGTLRLGLYPCKLAEETNAYNAYNEPVVYERHRHRYEFNNQFRPDMEKEGFVFSVQARTVV